MAMVGADPFDTTWPLMVVAIDVLPIAIDGALPVVPKVKALEPTVSNVGERIPEPPLQLMVEAVDIAPPEEKFIMDEYAPPLVETNRSNNADVPFVFQFNVLLANANLIVCEALESAL
jgi:hypothetical protein